MYLLPSFLFFLFPSWTISPKAIRWGRTGLLFPLEGRGKHGGPEPGTGTQKERRGFIWEGWLALVSETNQGKTCTHMEEQPEMGVRTQMKWWGRHLWLGVTQHSVPEPNQDEESVNIHGGTAWYEVLKLSWRGRRLCSGTEGSMGKESGKDRRESPWRRNG